MQGTSQESTRSMTGHINVRRNKCGGQSIKAAQEYRQGSLIHLTCEQTRIPPTVILSTCMIITQSSVVCRVSEPCAQRRRTDYALLYSHSISHSSCRIVYLLYHHAIFIIPHDILVISILQSSCQAHRIVSGTWVCRIACSLQYILYLTCHISCISCRIVSSSYCILY